ncbi:hypothetical protein BGZ82_010280 [Podila clonocystis]|nr:hypothetical protein BGZ82_010280 [Podila clonocystis]
MRVIASLTALASSCVILASGQVDSKIAGGNNTCRTKECYAISANILEIMNPNIDPCENFYEYSSSRLLQKAQGFYKSCMNETRIAEVGRLHLYKELEELVTVVFPVKDGSLISFSPNAAPSVELLNTTDRKRLTFAIAHLYRTSTLSILNFYSFPDERTPEIQTLWISRSDSVVPDSVLLEETPLRTKYRKAIEEIYTFVFGKSEGATKFAYDVIMFETKIANFSDGSDATPYVTAAELNKLYPSLDWPLLLQKVVQGTNMTLDRELKNDFPPYVDLLDKLLRETPASTLQSYFAWEIIIARSRALPTQHRQRINRITSILDGDVNPDAAPERWSICVDSTSTHFASVIGHFYISQMFPSATKNQVQNMVDTIREAYRTDFQGLGWLDNSTRANAITKLDATIELIGYSTVDPNVGSAEALEKYYAAVQVKEDEYYSNVVRAKAQILKNLLARLGRPTERNRMDQDAQYVDAYYHFWLSHFAVLAGIVQPPSFTANAPEYLNFGALGMIAGHEISHGFDNFGRNYGPRGELHDWWANTTAAEFESRSKCFIDQYSNFTVTGPESETLHVNGEQTLGENISDNGGIKVAFMAWSKRFASDQDSIRYNNQLLPGRGVAHLTREQLFFVSFGQSWCRVGTPAYFKNQVRDGVHAPNHARVLGTVQNSRDFARAFKCKIGSPMNLIKKCRIW